MISQAVVSSNISRIGYQRGTLYIMFNSGVAYAYPGVPFPTYNNMAEAESVGQFFHHHIKNKFTHTKLEHDPFKTSQPA
jgi:hypothetical protein